MNAFGEGRESSRVGVAKSALRVRGRVIASFYTFRGAFCGRGARDVGWNGSRVRSDHQPERPRHFASGVITEHLGVEWIARRDVVAALARIAGPGIISK